VAHGGIGQGLQDSLIEFGDYGIGPDRSGADLWQVEP
jgi:hypothetical protein